MFAGHPPLWGWYIPFRGETDFGTPGKELVMLTTLCVSAPERDLERTRSPSSPSSFCDIDEEDKDEEEERLSAERVKTELMACLALFEGGSSLTTSAIISTCESLSVLFPLCSNVLSTSSSNDWRAEERAGFCESMIKSSIILRIFSPMNSRRPASPISRRLGYFSMDHLA